MKIIAKFFSLLLIYSLTFNAIANTLPPTDLANTVTTNKKSMTQEFADLRQKILKAQSLMQAKELALSPTDDALAALQNANAVVPFNNDLKQA